MYICVYVYMYICVCIYMLMYVYICMYIYVCMYICVYICIYVCIYIYIYTYIHTHTHTYIYTHTYIHIYIHTQNTDHHHAFVIVKTIMTHLVLLNPRLNQKLFLPPILQAVPKLLFVLRGVISEEQWWEHRRAAFIDLEICMTSAKKAHLCIFTLNLAAPAKSYSNVSFHTACRHCGTKRSYFAITNAIFQSKFTEHSVRRVNCHFDPH